MVNYESPAKGDAIMRMNWRSAECGPNVGGCFFKESLSPHRLKYDNANGAFRESVRVHKGRELFATLRCEACHGGEHIGGNLTKDSMPELTMDAPVLAEAGKRLNAAWIAKWLKDPRALRNDSSMPQLLRGATAEKDAEDIAGFLSTLGTKDEKPELRPNGVRCEWHRIGRAHVHAHLGCIGCHMLPTTQKAASGARDAGVCPRQVEAGGASRVFA